MNPSLSHKLSAFVQKPEHQQKASHYKRMLVLAEKIYGRRKDLKLSQTDLAVRAGITQRIISELEYASYASKQGIGEDMYDKLAKALEIDRDYLFSEKIDRKTFELFAYLGEKLNWEWDIMQFMKLPYFIDWEAVKKFGFQISNFAYIRLNYGPFDKNIYTYRNLFEGKKYIVEFSYIKDFLVLVESTLQALPIKNGEKLKMLSYETAPMKSLGATLGGQEHWGESLNLQMI